jgi:hypothetical protein
MQYGLKNAPSSKSKVRINCNFAYVRVAIRERVANNKKPPMAKKIGAWVAVACKLDFTPGGETPAGSCERSIAVVRQIDVGSI